MKKLGLVLLSILVIACGAVVAGAQEVKTEAEKGASDGHAG